MSYVWSFNPDTRDNAHTYTPYRPRPKKKEPSWIAPEHAKGAMGMRRDFPRDDRGDPLPDRKKELVVDARPTIMVPERPKRYLFL